MDESNAKTSTGAALLAQHDYEQALTVFATALRLDDRFVQAARASQGADRLHAWGLVYHCRAQVSDPQALREALREIQAASGLVADRNAVDLTHFNGQLIPPEVGSLPPPPLATPPRVSPKQPGRAKQK